jgi:enoyl-CoA hydratase/carnithine racemase
LFDRIENPPIPVIAAINGFALGSGCEMSLACDFRVIPQSSGKNPTGLDE